MLTVTNGLPSKNIWALCEDPEGVLWVGTANGLARLHGGRITGLSVAFHVESFYHETVWFRAGVDLGLAALTALAIRWRWRESRRMANLERLNASNEQRRQIARDIHDELGASLTHILQLSDRARAPTALEHSAGAPVERIASIAGEAVDSIGEIVWANNLEYDTLEDLVAYLREYTAKFFADTPTALALRFPEGLPPRRVTGSFRRHLVLLLKEALQNVSKHAASRHVEVRLTVEHGTHSRPPHLPQTPRP